MSKQKTKKKKQISRKHVIFLSIAAVLVAGLLVFVWVRSLNAPSLGADFVLTRHSVTKGIATMPREQYCFATNVAPREFTQQFINLRLVDVQQDEESTLVLYSDSTRGEGEVVYKTKESLKGLSYDSDDFVCNDFRGMKYTVHFWDKDMWVINPDNLDPVVRDSVDEQ